jgi:hypothetical protein
MTIEERTLLNGEKLMVNIAHDMCLRLQNDAFAFYWAFHRPVHNTLVRLESFPQHEPGEK